MISLLRALSEMHEIGFVHRDLKETNYKVKKRVGGSLQVVLLDFAGVWVATKELEVTSVWKERLDRYVLLGDGGASWKRQRLT